MYEEAQGLKGVEEAQGPKGIKMQGEDQGIKVMRSVLRYYGITVGGIAVKEGKRV